MMKLYARPARIWSAVTCHRFYRFGDLSPKQGRVQRPGRAGRLLAFDGDKSPAESADKSAHSRVAAAPPHCTTMMKLCARPARIWSAVTCQSFCRFGDLSPKQGRVQRPGRDGRLPAFDGDKSPAESADESAHSRVAAASPRCVHLWFLLLALG